MSESKTASEALTSIREVVESYLILFHENPEQNPRFVIRQLSKVFDSTDSTNFNDGNDEASILLTKIQRIYGAYKMLLKWDADDAPQILLENLYKILLPDFGQQRKPEVNSTELVVAPTSKNVEESSNDLFPSEHPAIEFPGYSSDQGQNKELSQDSEFDETENEHLTLNPPPSPSSSEDIPPPILDKYEPVQVEQGEKTKTGNLKSLYQNQSSFCCQVCRKPFNRLSDKMVHQRFCSKPFRFGRGKPKVSPSFTKSKTNVDVETKVKLNLIPAPSSSSGSTPNNNQQQQNTTAVVPFNPASSTGFVPNPEEIKEIILTATKNTLKISGWNRKNPGKVDRKPKNCRCHLCNNGKKYDNFNILANHVRLHTKERPFSCLHRSCPSTFTDSLNFTKHVKRAHGENGSLMRIRQNKSTSKGNLKKSKVKAPSRKKKVNLGSKGKGDIGKSLRAVKTNFLDYKSDEEEVEEEMETSEDENDKDYRPSFSNSSSGSGSRKRKRSQQGSFPCEFCGRLFRRMGHRSDHIKLKHTREGLFFCSVCGYGTLTQYKLNLHEAGHKGMDCPIPCNYCDRRFKTQESLQLHEKIWCLEKPFNL